MTSEIKAKIFSLYLGQKVEYNFNNKKKQDTIYGIISNQVVFNEVSAGSTVTTKNIDKCYLVLRSVKQLTGVEMTEIHKLLFPNTFYPNTNYVLQFLNVIESPYQYSLDDDFNCKAEYEDISALIDYLRSIGIALPVTTVVDGAVRTIGVEEMVEEKIICLDI